MNTQTVENRATFETRLRNHFSQKDMDEIMFAYDLSKEAHRTHKRDSGERYFEHLRVVVIIVLDELGSVGLLGLYDKKSIIGLLLHDTGEDSPIFGSNKLTYDEFVTTVKFRIGKIFGSDVADIVISLTKPFIDNVRFMTKDETNTYYLDGLQKDPKVLLLKMIDRLHNVRSLSGCSETKRIKITKETIEVYLPLFEKIYGDVHYGSHAQILVKKISEALNILVDIKMHKVICQKWEESEAGWGTRPDGYTLHLSDADCKKFIKAYWARMPKAVPDEYSRPDGTPYECEVDEKTFKEVEVATKEGKFGKWGYGKHPVGGKDGWLREEERKALEKA